MCPRANCDDGVAPFRLTPMPPCRGIQPPPTPDADAVSMIWSGVTVQRGRGTFFAPARGRPLFNQVCLWAGRACASPQTDIVTRVRRPPLPRPEKEGERTRTGKEGRKEGKENLSLSPHKNFPAFLSLSLRRLSERASERARGGKWKVRDGDEWERATMRERERERRGRGRLTLNSSVHRSCTRPPARAH